LPKFAADLFKVENTDFWLTPTSEVELHNLYRNETIPEEKLPIHSPPGRCFRSEAGAAGKDTRASSASINFRRWSFSNSRSEKSYEEHESLLRNRSHSPETRSALPHGVALHRRHGFASSKTYDIEVWLPSSSEFREISSCSNCEAFQARRAGIRFKPKSAGKSDFVHTFKRFRLAVGRTWIAVVETINKRRSISIPEVLRRTWARLHPSPIIERFSP